MAPSREPRIEELRQSIREFVGTGHIEDDRQRAEASQQSEWLKLLYQTKLQQHIDDQSRIWISAATFVPIGLTPFGVVVLRDELSPTQVVFAAIGSLALLITWDLLTVRIQWHADRALDWVRAIRREVGIFDAGRQEAAPSPLRQRTIRRMLTTAVALAWVYAIVAAQNGWL